MEEPKENLGQLNRAWTGFLPAFIRGKIEGREYLQNVVSNTGWQFADNLLRMGIGLFVGIWIARYLGPEQFGLLSYALAFVTLFSALASLGLDDIVVRDIVRDPASRNEILGSAFFLKVIGGALSFLASTGSIFLLRPTDSLSHWMVGIVAAGAVFQAMNIIEFWFHSQVQAKYSVIAKNAAFIICAVIKIGLILVKAPLIAFAWVSLVEIVIGSTALVVAYRYRGLRLQDWRVSLEKAKILLRDSWPLVFSSIVIMVYLRIDQVMLGEMIGSEEVGIYSVAVRLAEVWFFVPTAIYWSVFPSVVEAKAQSELLFYERLQKLYNLMALSAYAVAVPVTLSAQWLVGTLFGEDYVRGGPMLAVLIWANVFISLEMARSSFLTAMNWTRIYFLTVFLGGVLNVVLNYYLIPKYGGMGAVIASLISYWFASHGSCFLFKSLFRTGSMLAKALVYPKVW
jgi:O-antigen/teichoic acid export membrane protein